MLQYQFFARIDEDSDISEGTIFRVSTLYKLYSVGLFCYYFTTGEKRQSADGDVPRYKCYL